MIPFALFTTTILDSGIVRVQFNNVQWTQNGDVWNYTIPRSVHLSGLYPKSHIVDLTNHTLTGVQVQYDPSSLTLIAVTPIPSFTGYFMGDNSESQPSSNMYISPQRNIVSNADSIIAYAVTYKNSNGDWFGSGRNDMFAWGSNSSSTTTWRSIDTPESGVKIKDIQFGAGHSVMLLENGNVYGTGDNKYNQLGLGSTQDVGVWTKINFSSPVKLISVGSDFTYFILDNGDSWSCGLNYSNVLGHGGSALARTAFQQSVVDIRTNFRSAFLKTDTNEWYAIGYNYGHMGVSTVIGDGNVEQYAKIFVDGETIKDIFLGNGFSSYCITDNDNVYYAGHPGGAFERITVFRKIPEICGKQMKKVQLDVTAGMAITETGDVYACGSNAYNSNGTGNSTADILTWVDITPQVGKQVDMFRGMSASYLYDGSNVRFAGDSSYGMSGVDTLPNHNFDIVI